MHCSRNLCQLGLVPAPQQRRVVVRVLVCQLTLAALLGGVGQGGQIDYLRQVKPLLRKHCYACHGALRQRGGLRLDTVPSARRGGESGPAIVGGDLAESLAYQAVTGGAGFEMPPQGEGVPLTSTEAGLLRQWILEGASGVRS